MQFQGRPLSILLSLSESCIVIVLGVTSLLKSPELVLKNWKASISHAPCSRHTSAITKCGRPAGVKGYIPTSNKLALVSCNYQFHVYASPLKPCDFAQAKPCMLDRISSRSLFSSAKFTRSFTRCDTCKELHGMKEGLSSERTVQRSDLPERRARSFRASMRPTPQQDTFPSQRSSAYEEVEPESQFDPPT